MAQTDIPHGADHAAARRPKLALRWAIRGMMLLCGLLMLAVLLSEPRVAERVHATLDWADELLSAPAAPTAAPMNDELRVSVAPEAEPEETGQRPIVRSMPKDRVPVRRAGYGSSD